MRKMLIAAGALALCAMSLPAGANPLREPSNQFRAICLDAAGADPHAQLSCELIAEVIKELPEMTGVEVAERTVERYKDDPGELVQVALGTGEGGTSESTTGSLSFWNYPAPGSMRNANNAGETSIGAFGNDAMFLMSTTTARVTWNDASGSIPTAVWTDVSERVTRITTLDPILWTDPDTGRTFVTQLLGEVSAQAFTDDGGRTWTVTQPPTAAPSFDHQTVGGGPYSTTVAPPPRRDASYPNAVYYCAQIVRSQCARSDDGGLTWGPPLPMNRGHCGGLHGQVKVNPVTGHVFVPHKSCVDAEGNRVQGVYVSEDNALTWDFRPVPGTVNSRTDPNLAFDATGRAYFIAGDGSGRALVAVSEDSGRTWTAPKDVGAPFSVQNTVFPMATAGDDGRAAVAFYGSQTPGDNQSPSFDGSWYVFSAVTTDAGQTWETVNVTPGDPVQIGCIWLQGGTNACRNLLDFQGMTHDADGRVLIGYADGCRAGCNSPDSSRNSYGTIARQLGGERLVAPLS